MVQIKEGRRRPYLSTDRNHIRADTTRITGGTTRASSERNPTSGLGGDAISRKSLQTCRRTDGWTPDGPSMG